jgi:hypothetical protein
VRRLTTRGEAEAIVKGTVPLDGIFWAKNNNMHQSTPSPSYPEEGEGGTFGGSSAYSMPPPPRSAFIGSITAAAGPGRFRNRGSSATATAHHRWGPSVGDGVSGLFVPSGRSQRAVLACVAALLLCVVFLVAEEANGGGGGVALSYDCGGEPTFGKALANALGICAREGGAAQRQGAQRQRGSTSLSDAMHAVEHGGHDALDAGAWAQDGGAARSAAPRAPDASASSSSSPAHAEASTASPSFDEEEQTEEDTNQPRRPQTQAHEPQTHPQSTPGFPPPRKHVRAYPENIGPVGDTAEGEGLSRAVVGRRATFTVTLRRDGDGRGRVYWFTEYILA